MNIYVNAQRCEMESGCSLQDVLVQQGYMQSYMAVAVNQQFVAKTMYEKMVLQPNDQIDIVSPMQGG